MKRTSLLLSAIVALTGCSILTSRPQTTPSELTRGLRYNLPKALVHVILSHRPAGPSTQEAYGVEISPIVVPDREAAFVLDYSTSILSSDKFTITTTTAGLLTKVETTVEDQTDAIILKVIETAKEAAKFAAVAAIGEPIADFTFDPAEIDRVNEEISRITGGTVSISMDLSLAKPKPPTETCDGVLTRPPETTMFHVRSSQPTVSVMPSSTLMVLPSPTRLVCINLRRAAMVEKITNVTFENGMPTEIHLEKPSEALAFVEIPLTAAKTLASLPAELLQVKIDYSSKVEDLAAARKAELEAKQALLEAMKGSQSGSEPK